MEDEKKVDTIDSAAAKSLFHNLEIAASLVLMQESQWIHRNLEIMTINNLSVKK